MRISKVKFATYIKNRDGNRCRICGSREKLNAHHLNLNENDCDEENGITLCRACHMIVHSKAKHLINRHQTLENRGGNSAEILFILSKWGIGKLQQKTYMFRNPKEEKEMKDMIEAELTMYKKTLQKKEELI